MQYLWSDLSGKRDVLMSQASSGLEEQSDGVGGTILLLNPYVYQLTNFLHIHSCHSVWHKPVSSGMCSWIDKNPLTAEQLWLYLQLLVGLSTASWKKYPLFWLTYMYLLKPRWDITCMKLTPEMILSWSLKMYRAPQWWLSKTWDVLFF